MTTTFSKLTDFELFHLQTACPDFDPLKDCKTTDRYALVDASGFTFAYAKTKENAIKIANICSAYCPCSVVDEKRLVAGDFLWKPYGAGHQIIKAIEWRY